MAVLRAAHILMPQIDVLNAACAGENISITKKVGE
jgi:hypothetical protein